MSTWGGDGAGASNDPSDYEPTTIYRDGFPLEYSCEHLLTFQPRTAVIEYDYEVAIYANSDKGLADNVIALEWNVMFNVARSIGIEDECELEPVPTRRRRKIRNLEIDESLPHVVALSRQEGDVYDAATGSCEYIDEPGSICIPLQGYMTVKYTGDNANQLDLVEAYILEQVEQAMEPEHIFFNDIAKVYYVGDRDAIAPKTTSGGSSPKASSPGGDSSSRGVGMGISISVCLVVLAALALLVVRRKKMRQKEAQDELVDDDLYPPSSCDTNFNNSQDMEAYEVEEAKSDECTAPPNAEPDIALAIETAPPIEDPVPLPPVSGGRLKPQRKRKKKKKTKALRRVNSRENIKEMETITEVEDEDPEDYEYFGSENSYSTDDEDIGWSSSGSQQSTPERNSEPAQFVPKSPVAQFCPPSPILEEKKIKKLPPPWI